MTLSIESCRPASVERITLLGSSSLTAALLKRDFLFKQRNGMDIMDIAETYPGELSTNIYNCSVDYYLLKADVRTSERL